MPSTAQWLLLFPAQGNKPQTLFKTEPLNQVTHTFITTMVRPWSSLKCKRRASSLYCSLVLIAQCCLQEGMEWGKWVQG